MRISDCEWETQVCFACHPTESIHNRVPRKNHLLDLNIERRLEVKMDKEEVCKGISSLMERRNKLYDNYLEVDEKLKKEIMDLVMKLPTKN